MGRRGPNEGTIRKRPDGRWEARVLVTEPDGQRVRRSLLGRSRAAVAERMREALRAESSGIPLPTERLTVGAYLDQWLTDAVRPRVRPRTFQSYAGIVRVHLAPGLGQVLLVRLSPQQAQAFLNAKSADEPDGGLGSLELTEEEAPLALGRLPVTEEIERRAAGARVAGRTPSTDPPPDVVDEWELDELLLEERGGAAARAQTGHVARRAPLADELGRAGSHPVMGLSARHERGLQPLTRNSLSLMLRRRYHAGGGTLPTFGSHRIRHATATLLVNHGMPLEEVSRYLGHSSTDVTRRYAQQTPDALGARAADAVLLAGLVGR